jgi:hypothetical protein
LEESPETLKDSDLPEAPVVAASKGSPEMPEMPQSPERKRASFPRKRKQKSDSSKAIAVPEESLVPAAA